MWSLLVLMQHVCPFDFYVLFYFLISIKSLLASLSLNSFPHSVEFLPTPERLRLPVGDTRCCAAWDILLWGQEPSDQAGLKLSAAAVVGKGELAFSQPFYSLWAFWKVLRAKCGWLDSYCLFARIGPRPYYHLPFPPTHPPPPSHVSLVERFYIDPSRQRDQRHFHGTALWPSNPQSDEWISMQPVCQSVCLSVCLRKKCCMTLSGGNRKSLRPAEGEFIPLLASVCSGATLWACNTIFFMDLTGVRWPPPTFGGSLMASSPSPLHSLVVLNLAEVTKGDTYWKFRF